jgi:hypothetical protein
VAGIAYLIAQSLFSVAAGGTGAEPFQRISAILLGPEAVAPAGAWSARVIGMALLVHLTLAAVYGRLIDVLVMHTQSPGVATLIGAVTGMGLFALNRIVIAPAVFPWFDASRNVVTAYAHVLFGVIAAVLCVAFRRFFVSRGRRRRSLA